MNQAGAILQRISAITGLTFREAQRRRLVIVFITGCLLFLMTGGGCAALCMKMRESGIDQARVQYERELEANNVPAEQRSAMLAEFDRRAGEDQTQAQTGVKTAMLATSFSIIAFWSYAIALFLIPFLAFSDFQNNTHILTLSRPVQRWEYLAGRILGMTAIVFASMFLLLIFANPMLRVTTGAWGWELLIGAAILAEGLFLWIALITLFTLIAGRLPAIFLGVAVIILSSVPAPWLLQDQTGEGLWGGILYALGYGLPQLGVNFFYAFSEVLKAVPEVNQAMQQQGIGRIGNMVGPVSLGINAAWIALCWAANLYIFKRREVNA